THRHATPLPYPTLFRSALEPSTGEPPFGSATDADGTTTTIWRCADGDAIAAVSGALRDAELLIADGHHRYETARVYADEVGGERSEEHTSELQSRSDLV